jgi:hypothetical protein
MMQVVSSPLADGEKAASQTTEPRCCFTEDLDHELAKCNKELQRAKRRLRDANAALQTLYAEFQAANEEVERQAIEVASARNLVTSTKKAGAGPRSVLPELVPYTAFVDFRHEIRADDGRAAAQEAEELQRKQKMHNALMCLDRVVAQHAQAVAAQTALQLRFPAVNLAVEKANADVKTAFKAVNHAVTYEMMLARQDCSEITGAYTTLLGRAPGKHWSTAEELEEQRRVQALDEAEASAAAEADRAADEAQHESARRMRSMSSALTRSALSSAVVRPPAVPPLPLLDACIVPVPQPTVQTDRPWPSRGPASIGQGLTPRIVIRGGLAGQSAGTAAFNKALILPQPPKQRDSTVVPLPAIPSARSSRVSSALKHQPVPRSWLEV